MAEAIKSDQKDMRCFACNRKLRRGYVVSCIDDQRPIVGFECLSKVIDSGLIGFQPSLGGPRLFQFKPEANTQEPQK